MENINIAVIGAAGVGKSTLIQRALGLRSLPTAVSSSQKMSVDNIVYTVSLVELDLETFDFNPDRRVQWPKQINGQIVPRMDGALILYDVMNRESIIDLPQTLSEHCHFYISLLILSSILIFVPSPSSLPEYLSVFST
jgi:GTPase SAR1 family protein